MCVVCAVCECDVCPVDEELELELEEEEGW